MAGKGKASKTKLKDKKKTSSQTSGATIKDEMLENQDTEPRFGFMMVYGANFSTEMHLPSTKVVIFLAITSGFIKLIIVWKHHPKLSKSQKLKPLKLSLNRLNLTQ